MTKIKGFTYYSQVTSFPWGMVAKTACGITSSAMAISYFLPEVTPMDVLVKACELHKVPSGEENYRVIVRDRGVEFAIPIGQKVNDRVSKCAEENKLKIIRDPGQGVEYEPVFSLNNGFDHRGSERLFGSFGMEATKVGDKQSPLSMMELRDLVEDDNLVLVSVVNNKEPWLDFTGDKESSHVMLITGVELIGGDDYYYVYDPLSMTGRKKIRYILTEDFESLTFSGYGTKIKK